MHYFPEVCWYVLRTRSKAEELVKKGLQAKEIDLLHPTYQAISKRRDRHRVLTKPIFKGYLFVHLQLAAESHLVILKTMGVIEILKNSHGPVPVPDEQIENVRLLEHHVGECFHAPEFGVGERVVVREGPLTGLRGVVDQVNRGLLRVSIESVPGSIVVEIDPKQLQSEDSGLYMAVAGS